MRKYSLALIFGLVVSVLVGCGGGIDGTGIVSTDIIESEGFDPNGPLVIPQDPSNQPDSVGTFSGVLTQSDFNGTFTLQSEAQGVAGQLFIGRPDDGGTPLVDLEQINATTFRVPELTTEQLTLVITNARTENLFARIFTNARTILFRLDVEPDAP